MVGPPAEGDSADGRFASVRHRVRRLLTGRLAKVLAGLVVAVVIVVVTPLRGPVSTGLSKVILLAARPFAPDVSGFTALPGTSRILAADGTPIADVNPNVQSDAVTLPAVPPPVVHAVLAAEDANFYHHSGVDPSAVLRAMVHSVIGGRSEGGSTITQQLAKLNYTGSKHTIARKFKEVLFASELERKYSKDQLLERYLNQVYFGRSAYGIGAAARTFFGTTPDHLTPAQAALLAGKIRAPTTLDPATRMDAVVRRRDEVLDAMVRHQWLAPQQAATARTEPVVLAPAATSRAAGYAPHFVDFVRREAGTLDVLGVDPTARGSALDRGGYTVRTTLDRKTYDAAVAAVQATLGAPGDPATAVVSVQPGDGAIRALFGGLGASEFDVASQGRRQPGSAFKPFTYLAALDAGIDPRTPFPTASPVKVPCPEGSYSVKNYSGEDAGGGTVDVDTALAHSINVVFAQLVSRVGPTKVVAEAERDGIPAGIHPGCAVGLGGIDPGVSPLDMAAAYAAFADRGIYAKPYAITEIAASTGRVIYRHQPSTHNAFDDTHVGVLNAALTRVVTEGTGRAAAIGRPVAGKTGTTEGYGDAWFVGFVPQLATAVWVGHPEAVVPMTDVHGVAVAGGTYPARIFAQTMRAALTGVPVEPIFVANPDQLGLQPSTTTSTSSPPSTTTTATTTTTPASSSTSTSRPTATTIPPSSTTTSTTTPPDAPQNLRARTSTGASTGVTLDWQPPATTPGGSIVGYRIYRSRLQGQETAYADTGSTTGTYHDTGTTPGQTYWYSVTAVYANGTESSRSNEASAIAR